MKIGIVQPGRAFYPETNAYIKYLPIFVPGVLVSAYQSFERADLECDVVLFYGGYLPFWKRVTSKLIIEYHSLSTTRFPRLKNFVKRWFSAKADLYIFLNDMVRAELGFGISEKNVFRGMGVDERYYNSSIGAEKKYDFVYMGSVDREGVIDCILSVAASEYSVAVVGCSESAYKKLSSYSRVYAYPGMSQENAVEVASAARFGLNFTADRYPFNIQDSTKVIEYCGLGLNVVTNRYLWVDYFESNIGARFLDLNEFLSNPEVLNEYEFSSGRIDEYFWSNVIGNSGLVSALKSIRAEI